MHLNVINCTISFIIWKLGWEMLVSSRWLNVRGQDPIAAKDLFSPSLSLYSKPCSLISKELTHTQSHWRQIEPHSNVGVTFAANCYCKLQELAFQNLNCSIFLSLLHGCILRHRHISPQNLMCFLALRSEGKANYMWDLLRITL